MTKRKSTRKADAALSKAKFGVTKLVGVLKLRTKRIRHVAIEAAVKAQLNTQAKRLGGSRRLTLDEAAISRSELASRAVELSDAQRARLQAARARAEARLRRPDMSAEAVQARERAGAEWEGRHGPVTAFAGARRGR
ncbi:hypothetical protein C0Z18_26345 [Trinickia dabaoshanensis]|uniref:Uncharacterized protein n=2 Tax=Trinickia dabaoshanensis TaxID=564714 RepID=A0A2N7VEG2_9BURK|nr:hypothetical protein C0Z18_26345 [Trinickia dabaoshanensis]